MSVTEYQREFTRLSKCAPEILVSEEERCHRFEDSHNDHNLALSQDFSMRISLKL